MCKPAGILISPPDATSTSSGSIGTRRGVSIWRTGNRNGSAGTESAFTSARRLWRWIPFAAPCDGSPGYVGELRKNGISLKYLDFGGGLGVRYTTENPPGRAEYARMVAQILRPLGLHLLLEPGRTIIGPAGVLLTRVVYVKESRGKTFVVVDAAMNDLMRPALYGAVHPITQSHARKKRRRPASTSGCRRSGLRDRGLFFARLATGSGRDRRHLGDLGRRGLWDEPGVELQRALSSRGGFRGRERFRLIRRRERPQDLLRGQVLR